MSTLSSLKKTLLINKHSRNALHNFIESTSFTTIPYYEDNLNLLKKKNILRLDMTHHAFDHLWQSFSLQNIPHLANDNNNSLVRRQG